MLAAARAYREAMRGFAAHSNLDLWYTHVDVSQIRERSTAVGQQGARKAFDATRRQGARKDRLRALSKLTHRVDGELRIVSDPPLIVPIEELFARRAR